MEAPLARRSTTSEYQPAPPINRLGGPAGSFASRGAVRVNNTGGVKVNVGCAPPPGSTRGFALRLALR